MVDVREEGGQVIVTTAEASLEDVIVEGTLAVRRAITADDVGQVETLPRWTIVNEGVQIAFW